MEKDERLLPLPNVNNLQTANQEEPTQYSPIYEDEFDANRSLREYFNVVYKRLPIILALTILTTAAVAFYMYRQPSIFEARSEMIIEPRKPKLQSKDAININFGDDVNYYNTQLRLLQNPDLMQKVVVELNLHRDPNLFSGQNRGFLSTIRSMISSEKETQSRQSSLPILTETNTDKNNNGQITLTPEEKERVIRYAGILLGGLRVVQIERTNIINIFVQNTNAELAAKTADMVSATFIKEDTERETEGSKKALEDLSKSTEELKANINSQEQERINYMRSSGLPLREGKGNDLLADRLRDLSGKWLSAEDDRRKLSGLYEAAQRASTRGDILSVVGDNKAIQDARSQNLRRTADLEKRIENIDEQIQNAEAEKAALSVKYQPEYPEVKKVEIRIEKLKENREKIKNEVSRKIETEGVKLAKNAEREVLNGLQAQLQAAQKREGELRSAYMTEVASANVAGQAETRLTTLSREIETSRGLLDTYIQRQKELELTISSSTPDNILISSRAQTPMEPIGPNRNRNILVAFLISLAAGIGLAFLLDYLDDSIKTSDDIGRHLGLPTLALIPHTGINARRKLSPTSIRNGDDNLSSMALAAIEDNRSAQAEAYRHLRTSLLFSSAGKPPQTILITSAQPAEGKTTTAINTAITLAQSGVDVVIIDCDLRRPRLHKHFGVANAVGLTSYLSGEKNPDSLVKSCEGMPNLKVITSGPIPPNPAELLSSNEMKNLLQFLKGNFKHIIIDSPPAVFFTDAAILSMIVDGVVLVALAGKSSIYLTRRFKQRLGSIGARIYGVVLNGIKSNSLEYSYYGYKYSYNYYTTDKDDDSTPFMEEDILSTIDGKKNGSKK
ncbi:MAG: polysaccharide biosynthesis tyrosine autokinase [Acidobacteria bacterium]|nr:polysaccharide biosynthesis tyrosine autokinase [Acidobacteriota bacterium]